MASHAIQQIDAILRKASPDFEKITAGARMEKLAGGFAFTEGPLWMPEGHLLFSDIPNNVIHQWKPDGSLSVFRSQSGYDRQDEPAGAFIGSNGLTLDETGRLLICEHGNHRLTRLEKNGELTVLAATYEGKRLNSPNDVVVRSDGTIYFSDPPYGLTGLDEDPRKELNFNGVFRLVDDELQLLYAGIKRPNGIAFSPDERVLYLANSDEERKIWLRFQVGADGTIDKGEVFYDVTNQTAEGLPDGMKVDVEGNLYCAGPAGVWIFAPDGRHLGIIQPPEAPANLHWGDSDGRMLYITARTGLYRIKLNVPGIRP